MAHIVTGRCVACRYTDCCAVCPVDCFYEIDNPAMLVIDPDTCIDCGLCIPECPIHAIYTEDETPEPYREWIAKNKELFGKGANITTKKDAMAGAKSLEQIQAEEKGKGWDVPEPTGA
ncbi:MAG: 4Fe-4S binding protein [Phycisphaerae bacterium]